MLRTKPTNVTNAPSVSSLWAIRSRPSRRSSAIAIAPKMSIKGELMAAAATERRLARNRRCAAFRNRATSQDSIPKAFTMRLPVIVSCKMFWTSASWSCPFRVVERTRRPIRTAEKMIAGTNNRSTQARSRPRITTAAPVKANVNTCCRNSASTLDMANCTRSMSLMMVEMSVPVVCLVKKAADRRRTELYKSLRRLVIMPNPAWFTRYVPA